MDSTPQVGSSPPAARKRRARLAWLLCGLAALNLVGLPYFILDTTERVRSPLHGWFKPSGYVGQTAGILTLLLFGFMYLYPLRKRFPRLLRFGSLASWLDVHIVAGLLIPLVGATHAGWRFSGLIGLGYLAMLLVSASGVAGKYIYTRIPRGRSGLELSLDEVERERTALTRRIAETTGLDATEVAAVLAPVTGRTERRGMLGAVVDLVRADLVRVRMVRALRRRWSGSGAGRRAGREAVARAVRLARRQIALTQQIRMLGATQRVFRFWHVVHRPFSVTAFVAVTIHVAVVVSVGVTWFR